MNFCNCCGAVVDDDAAFEARGGYCEACRPTAETILRELVDACTDRQRALDHLSEVKRAGGNWSLRPLPHTHPAIEAVRKTTARHAEVLRRAREFIA